MGSGVSEPQVAENRYLPLTGGIALTTVYALTCYTVIMLRGDIRTEMVEHEICLLTSASTISVMYTALVNGEVLYHAGASR